MKMSNLGQNWMQTADKRSRKVLLKDCFEFAEAVGLRKGPGHEPYMLFNTFDMHKNLALNGTMKVDK